MSARSIAIVTAAATTAAFALSARRRHGRRRSPGVDDGRGQITRHHRRSHSGR